MSRLLEKYHLKCREIIYLITGETFWRSDSRIVLPKYVVKGGECRNVMFSWQTADSLPNLTSHLTVSKKLNRQVIEVDLREAETIYDPVDRLCSILNHETDNFFHEKLSELVSLLENAGVNVSDIGITGSVLTSTHTPSSDIDLVIYGESNMQSLLSNLHKLLNGKRVRRLNSDDCWFSTLYKKRKRHFHSLNARYFLFHEKRRLQGMIDNVRFVVAFLRKKTPDYLSSINEIMPICPVKLEGVVSSSVVSGYDPSILRLTVKKMVSQAETKFAGQLPGLVGKSIWCALYHPVYSVFYMPNDKVTIEGMLERLATDSFEEEYQVAIRYSDRSWHQVQIAENDKSLW